MISVTIKIKANTEEGIISALEDCKRTFEKDDCFYRVFHSFSGYHQYEMKTVGECSEKPFRVTSAFWKKWLEPALGKR